ncbi:peptidase family C50-domain-containing protein [Flammula alnicola]|nr:peptidase family C50-domain-containing protein [Flammula alnicola]
MATATTRRAHTRQPSKTTKLAGSITADQLANELATKLTINNTKWKKKAEDINSSASSAAKHLAILRSMSPGDVDVERAAVSVLGKLIALEMVCQEFSCHKSSGRNHPRLCSLPFHLSIPEPLSPPTDPVILNLSQPVGATAKSIEELARSLDSAAKSLLAWLPSFSSLPAKHTDSLLTDHTPPSVDYVHPTSGNLPRIRRVIEPNTFWDQATRFAGAFVKATSSISEEQTTHMILTSYDEIVQLAEKRSDREAFMAVGEKGKSFLAFCEYWMGFAKSAGDINVLQKINALMQQASSSSSPASSHKGTKFCNAFAQLSSDFILFTAEALLTTIRHCTVLLKTSTVVLVLLQPSPRTTKKRSRDEEEMARMCGKTNATSASSTSLDSDVDAALRELLLECTLSASATRDVLTRCLDTLFILSRTKLNLNDPKTFLSAFEHLNRTVTILNSVPTDKFSATPVDSIDDTVDIANYTRCVSGAFYNLACSLYQATRYGNAVPFLVESCTLGGKALGLPRPAQKTPNETREKEWAQLEEQLFRRWELLAVCYSKNGDRKNAYNAFKQAIHTFPFFSSGLMAQSDTVAPDVLFGPSSSPAVKQLVGLVDRVSYVGACELLLQPEEVSLLSAVNYPSSPPETSHGTNVTLLDPSVTGALLERQLDSLEPSRWKEGVRDVFLRLLRDALEVYSASMPVRRARVLVRCMEFAYRDQGEDTCKTLGFASVQEMGQQIEALAVLQELGRDVQLAHFIPQYRIAAHLWVALHAHRRADPLQSSIMSQRTEDACRVMKELLGRGSEPSPKATRKGASPKVVKKAMPSKVGRIVSPRPSRATRQRVPAAPRKAAPVKAKAKANLDPVTPKPQSRAALQAVSFNTVQTLRQSTDGTQRAKPLLVFDDFHKFLSLLQLSARILGFLSLILPKAHLLDMTRKLAQRQIGSTSDGYVTASLDLAHEYATLGKLKRATVIFTQALEIVRSGQASLDVAVKFLLRFSETLALVEDVPKSSKIYLEALELSNQLDLEQKTMSTQQRIHARARMLEIAATAAHVFALIQFTNDDIYASLAGFLQSLRLWNRAVETLSRLNPPSRTANASSESDPFEMSSLKEALPSSGSGASMQANKAEKKPAERRPLSDGLEWRVSEGLLSTMLSLSQAYYLRGSAREAEYFARQATELAEQLNVPAIISRALAKQAEVQLHMGHMEEAQANLTKAAELLSDMPGIDTADIRRLRAEYNMRAVGEEEDMQQTFAETVSMLEELDTAFRQFDNLASGPRRSVGASPGSKDPLEVLAPELLVSILCQQLWLLRDEVGDTFNSILERLLSLSHSSNNKAEEHALMAKLTLHGVYNRFQTDMFLSSLTESTIAIPMGMGSKEDIRPILPSIDVMDALASAEKLLWAHLSMTSAKGNAVKVRDAAISLALIGAFRTSLGDRRVDGPSVMAALLDASAALTLRRDMLEAIEHKFPAQHAPDDLQWPLLSEDGNSLPRSVTTTVMTTRFALTPLSDSDDEDDVSAKPDAVKGYWDAVRAKYKSQILNSSTLSSSETIGLPTSWTIININVTPDKNTLFISRQEGGSESKDPLIFCIPLKGRRDHGSGDDDEEHLTFDGAVQEMQDIVRSSDECTKSAINIKSDDEDARCNWWKERGQLDVRMRELLENIEYCWLGAFKAILNPQEDISTESIFELRGQFEKVFHRDLHVKDKKPRSKPSAHKKSTSQSQTNAPTQFTLDDAIIKCFSTLSPKCRDEELEDLVYFVLDLYQFHGVPVAIAEVDVIQVVVDLRTVLEEHTAKKIKQKALSKTPPKPQDEHLFLVLDKNVQGFPWESMPILRGRSVSRIPGVQFLQDRLSFAQWKRESAGQVYDAKDGAVVDPRKGYYILNPSGDLGRTEERFRDWAKDMKRSGWGGVIGKQISEQQFVDALKSQDLVVYFGHGGGEQYVRSHRIRSLPTCAATMLWGCSSGALRDMGDFDRTGTPYNYMLGGCPTLVANLWDVTDKDIDKISQSVFDKLGLGGKEPGQSKEKRPRNPTSLVAAVAQSRDSCKLKYLTGAAPVVYGIPFYL